MQTKEEVKYATNSRPLPTANVPVSRTMFGKLYSPNESIRSSVINKALQVWIVLILSTLVSFIGVAMLSIYVNAWGPLLILPFVTSAGAGWMSLRLWGLALLRKYGKKYLYEVLLAGLNFSGMIFFLTVYIALRYYGVLPPPQ